jgi:Tol biopolymer transport system component
MYKRTLITLLVGIAASIALIAVPAGATPPGVNGQITYDINGGNGVVVANPDGSSAHLVAPNTCCGGWSPDGSKLAVTYTLNDGRIGPAIVNADGNGYTPFPIDDPLGTLNIGCGTGSWSPNGLELACQGWDNTNPDRAGIYTISSADGSNLTRVTNPNGGTDEPGAYSPDGTRLVFARFDQNGNPLGLFVVNTDGTNLRRITPPATIIQSGNDGDWSPRGNEIIFSRHLTKNVPGSIWVINADGTGLRRIIIRGLDCGASSSHPNAFGCHEPHWSPDGKKIIFAANSPTTGVNIYTANADGTGLTQVTFDGSSDDPSWGTHPLAH